MHTNEDPTVMLQSIERLSGAGLRANQGSNRTYFQKVMVFERTRIRHELKAVSAKAVMLLMDPAM
jgi:hypothetical protein